MAETDKESVTVVDGSGRTMKIPRKEWAEKIVPDQLTRARDDADALHMTLVGALRGGLAANAAVAEGIKRLAEIDKNAERVAVMRGIYLMETGAMDEAEKVLQDYSAAHGATPGVLTNLAKLYADRGEKERGEDLLRQAVTLDPNHDHAMGWYVLLQRQKGGEEAFLGALRELAGARNSWRPQLWLGRELLKKKQTEEAMDYYRQVVSQGLLTPDGFVQMTGDMGAAGEVARMLELALPVYDPERHGAVAGLNIVNALAQSGRLEEADGLLRKLQSRKNPATAPLLADTARRLAAAWGSRKPEAAAQAAAADGRVKVAAVPLFNPVWTPPLGKPQWLMPAKKDGVKIVFFSLADSTRSPDQPPAPVEPDSSRLTRSLPMYLAESLRLRSDAMAVCVIPVLPGKGPAVAATPWPLPQMIEACPTEFSPDMVVCGVVGRGARGARVELHLFRVKDRQALKTLRISAADDFTGTALKAEQELLAFLGNSGVTAVQSELKPPEKLDGYLSCLDDLLNQMLVASGVTKPEGMRDDREVYERYLSLAGADETSPLPVIAAAAGVLAAIKCKSATAGSFKEELLKVVRSGSERFGAVRKLAPVIYLRLGENEAYEGAKKAMEGEDDPAYRKWLEGLTA